jgi:hypothetical protein
MSLATLQNADDKELVALLLAKAAQSGRDIVDDWTHARYTQNDNPDALTDEWLQRQTSYIWRVGVLAFWDANKCDWCGLVIGQRRSPQHQPEFKGLMYWDDGENDDPARVVRRAMDAAADLHPVFNAD